MDSPTPAANASLRFRAGDFQTLADALDYAADGETGFNYYSVRGELKTRLPYATLRAEALDFAGRLHGLGLERGARVALVAETSPDFHRLFFACQYAGLIPVPMPLPMNLGGRDAYVRQIGRMMDSASASAAVASSDFIGLVREAGSERSGMLVATPDEIAALPHREGFMPFAADEPCYIQYSSGSTSAPKGVFVSQSCAVSNTRSIINHGLKIHQGDRCVSWLPLYHDMGLVGFCLTPLMSQMSVDYLGTADFARRPLMWLRLISENRGTLSFSPPFGYDLCQRRASDSMIGEFDLSSWRVAGIGGDMVKVGVLERFAERFEASGFRRSAFVASYGLAESTLAVSFASLESEIEADRIDKRELARTGRTVPAAPDAPPEATRSFVLCGRPMPGHQLEIRDDLGRTLGEREVGRILIKGPSVMEGYFENPIATAAITTPDGWLDTGDLGYLLNGQLVVTGRSKDLIICNGRNIWPQDIEWAIERIDGIRRGDAAAFSVESPYNGEQVVTIVQCRIGDPERRDSLIRQISAAVRTSTGVDCEVVLAPPRSLPLTSSGKLSRAATKAKYLAGVFTPSPSVATSAVAES